MNPAPSIVFFTTASGAGYGLLFWLGLLRPLGLVAMSPMAALVALVLALVLITAGLLSSTLHLGNPKRAWRAVSQWRSSWLSREGVAAILTYIPALLLGLGLWVDAPALALIAGLLAAAGAFATVYCTGMIYASLKPIRQWHHPLVVPGYLALSAFSGAVLLAMLAAFSGSGAVPALLAILTGAAALLLKRAYWQAIDTAPPIATIESATTLGFIGKTRPLDPPHTEQNYLLREMGFRIARKHATKLRLIAQLGGFALPALLALLALLAGGTAAALALTLGAILALAGLLVERWLMFAEATHTVTLYYRGS
ncbi:dimethyl sulfoxide reductase anchor subunit family protein [Belnapia rosea]|uniref:DMSO reductase anchor subunit n=1 Tax=Belnapia rosea TaxID=938405 RepID=A0A1G6W9R5_9PROT|nr:DmsC/YnfH family molybdoenzyme membrane anchor subunit [Belnapia rosea]SDD61776.1 DMSO reductase anchor subunit [Belnapia rosea]